MSWLILLFALSAPASAAEGGWGPWESRWAPVAGIEAVTARPAPRGGAVERVWQWYRGRSDKDGARCPFYPTCSGYGMTALRTRGPVVGGLLTADRLLREYPGMGKVDHYPLVTPHEIPRLSDPVPLPRRRIRQYREGRGAPPR